MWAAEENHFFFQNEDGLCGLRVATIAGTTQASALERANRGVCKQKPIELKYFPSFNDAAMQLRTKAADIAFVDWAFASYISRLMPELAPASPDHFGPARSAAQSDGPGLPQG